MMTTKELIDEALSLPVEERALLADTLLRSLNAPEMSMDSQWAEVAKRRLQELRSGAVEPIPGDGIIPGTPYIIRDSDENSWQSQIMARLARVVAPGVPHHVTQRGNRRQRTFFCDDDYKAYIELMDEWCCRCGVVIWA